jgi:hypothetical protein
MWAYEQRQREKARQAKQKRALQKKLVRSLRKEGHEVEHLLEDKPSLVDRFKAFQTKCTAIVSFFEEERKESAPFWKFIGIIFFSGWVLNRVLG